MTREVYFKIADVVEAYSVKKGFITQCIEQEWIDPVDHQTRRLDQEDIARLMLIRELREKMGVNDEAVPIILHLIDQINYLRLKMDITKT